MKRSTILSMILLLIATLLSLRAQEASSMVKAIPEDSLILARESSPSPKNEIVDNETGVVNEATSKDTILILPYEEEEEPEIEIFFVVEDMPRYNGSSDLIEFRKFIATNIIYPEIAKENGISGRVWVQFIVNSKGVVDDVLIVRGVDPSLDKEAVRVVRSSPRWIPGKQRGKPVYVKYILPVVFVLQ